MCRHALLKDVRCSVQVHVDMTDSLSRVHVYVECGSANAPQVSFWKFYRSLKTLV